MTGAYLTLEEAAPLLHAVVARAAADAGARVLAIKGPALAAQGLRSPRACADVDVLVPPRDLDAVVGELCRCGWERVVESTAPRIMPAHSVSLVRAGWPLSVDVHHYFPGFLAPPEEVFDTLWARRTDVPLAAVRIGCPDRVAHVALAALHLLREETQHNRAALTDLVAAVRAGFGQPECQDLVGVARRLDALQTLQPFLCALGLPAPDDAASDRVRDPDALEAWRLRVRATGSDPWVHELSRLPARHWPRRMWRAVMLSDAELLAHHGGHHHGGHQGRPSAWSLRLRRLRRGLRSFPLALLRSLRAPAPGRRR